MYCTCRHYQSDKSLILITITCDCAMDLGAVLQLNSHSLMAEFHQKPAENNEIA